MERCVMDRLISKDLIDWHGCSAVQFNPNKLGGRATVGNSRMDADGVLINYESGMTPEEISEDFGVPLSAVQEILDFSLPKRLKKYA